MRLTGGLKFEQLDFEVGEVHTDLLQKTLLSSA